MFLDGFKTSQITANFLRFPPPNSLSLSSRFYITFKTFCFTSRTDVVKRYDSPIFPSLSFLSLSPPTPG